MERFISCILIVFMIPLIAKANAFVQYDSVVTISSQPGSYAFERMCNIAKMNNDIQPNSENQITLVNAEMVYKDGCDISYPVQFWVEYDVQGRVKSYRYEYIEPVINLQDPAFNPQNPSLKLNFKKTVIVNILSQKKVIITENLERGGESIEKDIPLNNMDPCEVWIESSSFYKDFCDKGISPTTVVGKIQIYEMKNPANQPIVLRRENRKVSISMESPQPNMALSESFALSSDGNYFQEFVRTTKDSIVTITLTNPNALSVTEGEKMLAFPEE